MSAICHCVEWGNEESGFMPGYIIVFGPSMYLNGAMQEYAQSQIILHPQTCKVRPGLFESLVHSD